MQFGRIPSAPIFSGKLLDRTRAELAVWCAIAACTGRDFSAYPSQKKIAGWTGLHENTVREAVASLERLGILRAERGRGRGNTSQYVLLGEEPTAEKTHAPETGFGQSETHTLETGFSDPKKPHSPSQKPTRLKRKTAPGEAENPHFVTEVPARKPRTPAETIEQQENTNNRGDGGCDGNEGDKAAAHGRLRDARFNGESLSERAAGEIAGEGLAFVDLALQRAASERWPAGVFVQRCRDDAFRRELRKQASSREAERVARTTATRYDAALEPYRACALQLTPVEWRERETAAAAMAARRFGSAADRAEAGIRSELARCRPLGWRETASPAAISAMAEQLRAEETAERRLDTAGVAGDNTHHAD